MLIVYNDLHTNSTHSLGRGSAWGGDKGQGKVKILKRIFFKKKYKHMTYKHYILDTHSHSHYILHIHFILHITCISYYFITYAFYIAYYIYMTCYIYTSYYILHIHFTLHITYTFHVLYYICISY